MFLTQRSQNYDTGRMNLDQYLSRPGAESMASLARAIGMNQDQLRQWRRQDVQGSRRPSARSCAAMEKGTQGKITCEELRPDLTWLRVRDKGWPGRKGRPLLEVAE